MNSNYFTYILIREGASSVELEKKLQAIGRMYYAKPAMDSGYPNIEEELKKLSFTLEPLEDIYLNKLGMHPDGLTHGDTRFTKLSGAVAIFILLIACINFINLSTAKSANRAKEVGLRKVVGSYRSNLVNQFLSESILYSLLSFYSGTDPRGNSLPVVYLTCWKATGVPMAGMVAVSDHIWWCIGCRCDRRCLSIFLFVVVQAGSGVKRKSCARKQAIQYKKYFGRLSVYNVHHFDHRYIRYPSSDAAYPRGKSRV